MAIRELTTNEMESLVGTRHAVTGFEYPPNGLQPYYHWLIRTLHLLAEASEGAMRVVADDSGETVVRIAPGRITALGEAVAYAGGTLDLATFNNDTALIWAFNDAGDAAIGVGSDGAGWPATAHIKLAEVTLAAGEIAVILDRRSENLFRSAIHDHTSAEAGGQLTDAALSSAVSISKGGTGASSSAGAKANLGYMTALLDDAAPQLANDLDLDGFAIRTDVDGNIVLGNSSFVTGGEQYSIVAGEGASSSASYGIALGNSTGNSEMDGAVLGNFASNDGSAGVVIGVGASNSESYGAALGGYAMNTGVEGVSIGAGATNSGVDGLALGAYALNHADRSSAIGFNAIATAEDVVALGRPVAVPKAAADLAFASGVETVLMSDPVDLKMVADQVITLPAGTHFWITEVGVIVTAMTGMTVQPTIRFGISGSLAKHKAAAITTLLTGLHKREKFAPLVPQDGETTLSAGVTTGATATVMTGRFYWKGILSEDQ